MAARATALAIPPARPTTRRRGPRKGLGKGPRRSEGDSAPRGGRAPLWRGLDVCEMPPSTSKPAPGRETIKLEEKLHATEAFIVKQFGQHAERITYEQKPGDDDLLRQLAHSRLFRLQIPLTKAAGSSDSTRNYCA